MTTEFRTVFRGGRKIVIPITPKKVNQTPSLPFSKSSTKIAESPELQSKQEFSPPIRKFLFPGFYKLRKPFH